MPTPRRTWPSLALLVLIACSESPTSPPPPPPPVCTYAVAPAEASVPAGGGTATFQVTTGTTCAWTSVSGAAWLAVTSGQAGTGPGAVVVTASANPATTTRTGTLTLAGIAVTVTQDGQAPACTYTIAPTGAAFEANGGTATVAVTTTAGCTWQATAGSTWLTVLSGASGSGSGTVQYKVDQNPDPPDRTGHLTIAGHTFPVAQTGNVSACTYQVSPVTLSICMAWSYDLISSVTTQAGCPWTAASTAGWMTVTDGSASTGSGTVRVRGEDNYDARRSGIIEIRWPTVTAGQNVMVDQAGCTYVATPSTFSFTSTGGTGRFDVLQQSDPTECGGPLQNACVWSAVSNVPWIAVTSAMPRTGDEPVNFTVAENTGTSARTGTITVRNRLVTITQSGRVP